MGDDMNATTVVEDVKIFNPWNNKNKEIDPSNALRILKKYGWKAGVRNFPLFSKACIHKSYVDRPELWQQDDNMVIIERPPDCLPLRKEDNEELEFLGDRVIGLIIATYLSQRYPKTGEGFLTKLLSRIVNNKQLGKLAKRIGLSEWIILSRHMEDMCDGRNNLRILGSMFEAWIGAMYLQDELKGYGMCYEFIVRVIEQHIDFVELITEDNNYKDQLLRLFQAKFHVPPRYKEISNEGPPHERLFTMGVLDPDDNVIASSTARNKKMAEQEASRLALTVLGGSPTGSPTPAGSG